jgi:predicted TIM-barrel enzyme
MYIILSFALSLVLAMLAYAQTRSFVTRRLRYVDAIQSAIAPFAAGAIAAVAALPLTFLPLIGVGTAISIGLAVGTGVAQGARDVRHSLPRY